MAALSLQPRVPSTQGTPARRGSSSLLRQSVACEPKTHGQASFSPCAAASMGASSNGGTRRGEERRSKAATTMRVARTDVAGASEQWAEESPDEVLEMVKAELGPDLLTEPAQLSAEEGVEVGEWEEEEGEEGGEEEEEDEELERLRASLAAAGVQLDEDEEWDEDELDELFDRFGKTIISSPSTAPETETESSQQGIAAAAAAAAGAAAAAAAAAAGVVAGRGSRQEPPTDEQTEQLAVALAVAASDTKAGNIRVLDVRPLIYWTQYFVVATAFSRPQMDAMAKRMSDLAEGQFKRKLSASERLAPGPWTLLDYGDVVVHLFAPRERERYAIEEFYANAREVPLPFVQEERTPY